MAPPLEPSLEWGMPAFEVPNRFCLFTRKVGTMRALFTALALSGRGRVAGALGVMSVSLAVAGLAVAGEGVWSSQGPHGGYVSAMAVDPQSPATLYAAAGGGVFKSTDGGLSWTPARVGLPSVVLDALVIDPQTSTTLYAAAAGFNGGVFTSTDGGQRWAASLLASRARLCRSRSTCRLQRHSTQAAGVGCSRPPTEAVIGPRTKCRTHHRRRASSSARRRPSDPRNGVRGPFPRRHLQEPRRGSQLASDQPGSGEQVRVGACDRPAVADDALRRHLRRRLQDNRWRCQVEGRPGGHGCERGVVDHDRPADNGDRVRRHVHRHVTVHRRREQVACH